MSEQIVSRNEKISNWETIERISKTLSIVAIPIVLGFGSWIIQQRLQNQTINRDYVQLAVSILKEPQGPNPDRQMRDWAVKLLNENSPTKFNQEVAQQLTSGNAKLPENFSVTQSVAPVVDSSGSPHSEAANLERKGFDAIVAKDAETALEAFTKAETLWPNYHNLSEIKMLLEANRAALTAASRDGKSEPWSSFYRTLISKHSYGMPPDIKKALTE